MPVVTITETNFQKEVLESKKTVLVDFWAPWCGPCRMIGPIVEEIANETPSVKVCKINIDELPQFAAQYGVASIPTLMVFKNGTTVNKAIGARNKAFILQMLED